MFFLPTQALVVQSNSAECTGNYIDDLNLLNKLKMCGHNFSMNSI